MKSNEGGPAFPCEFDNLTKEPISFGGMEVAAGTKYVHEGMSLRDWFAAQALIGILACFREHAGAITVATRSAKAYEYADAMLAERAKSTGDA